MKYMSVPANLTFEQWYALVVRGCKEIGLETTAIFDPLGDWWETRYNDGLTVSEAISLYIGTEYAEDPKEETRRDALAYRLQEAMRVMLSVAEELSKGSRRSVSDIELLTRLHQESQAIAALKLAD